MIQLWLIVPEHFLAGEMTSESILLSAAFCSLILFWSRRTVAHISGRRTERKLRCSTWKLGGKVFQESSKTDKNSIQAALMKRRKEIRFVYLYSIVVGACIINNSGRGQSVGAYV